MNLYRYLLAEDFFVCYARADGYDYAEACASYLSKQGYACSCDQLTSLPGEEPPEELLRALRRSCVMVVVGSPGAGNSDQVRNEICLFSRYRRPIVPISFGNSLQEASWFPLLRGGPIAVETPNVLSEGRPSERVFRRIQNVATHRTRSQRQALAAVIALSVVIVAVIVGGYWLRREKTLADEAQARARAADILAKRREGEAYAAVKLRDQADRDARSTEIAMLALQPPAMEDGLASSLKALAISPTLAAKKSLLQNLSSVPHLRKRVLCPADEEPQSAFFSKDNRRLLLVCTGTVIVVSLPSLAITGRVSPPGDMKFMSSAVEFWENAGRIFAVQHLVSPKKEAEYLVWPPSPRAKLPEGPGVERSRGAATAALWQSSKDAALLKRISTDYCDDPPAPFSALNDRKSWGACTTRGHDIVAVRLDDGVDKETLIGHTESPFGHLANSVQVIAFDRNDDVRFLATGGELAGGRAGFLLWDLEQEHPLSETVRSLERQPNGRYGLVLGRWNSVVICSGCAGTVQIIELRNGNTTPIPGLPWFLAAAASPSDNVVFLEGPGGLWRLSLAPPYRLQRVLTTGKLDAVTAVGDDHVMAIEDGKKLLSWSPAGVVRADLRRVLPAERQPIPLAPDQFFLCAAFGDGGTTMFAEIPTKGESQYGLFFASLSAALTVTASRLVAIPKHAALCQHLAVARDAPILLRTSEFVGAGEVPVAVLKNYWRIDSKFAFVEEAEAIRGGVAIAADGKTAVADLRGGFALLDLVQNRFLFLMRPPVLSPYAQSDVAIAADGSFFLSASGARRKGLRKWSLEHAVWQQRTDSILGR